MIDNKFNELVKLSKLAKTANCKSYLAIDYAACYGGRRLVMVNSLNGGHNGAFGQSSSCSRMKPNEFYLYLTGLIEGIKFQSNSQKLAY
jgi:Flp pilus assembly CpaF family ATPase